LPSQSGIDTQAPEPSRYWSSAHSVEAFVSVFVSENGVTSQSMPVPLYLHQSPEFNVPPDRNKVASVSCVLISEKVSSSASVITSTQLPSPSRYSPLSHSVVALESNVINPASFVKSAKVTVV